MPELPDITVYVEALERRILGAVLERVGFRDPFVLRTAAPSVESLEGRKATSVRRIGKRVAMGLEDDYWVVIHLMVAGRLRWTSAGSKLPVQNALASFRFASGTLTLTEAGTKRRASLHVVQGNAALRALDPGGLEPLGATPGRFSEALARENHTLKRALTDPRLFSGIGNAFSDEILHSARLSPVVLTRSLTPPEVSRLFDATRQVLTDWCDRLRTEAGSGFPEGVTAFRPEMAVHGKFGKACPVCGTSVQRIRYADNESNYCPRCQTGGKLLADRSLSRLLKSDWPKTIEEAESNLRPIPGARPQPR